VAIHVVHHRAAGMVHVQGKGRAPVVHPVQRHAKQQVLLRLRGQLGRLRVACRVVGPLAGQKGLGAGPVNAGAAGVGNG